MKKIVLILVPVVVILLLAGGWMFMRGGSGDDPAAAATREGPVYEFTDPFVVNLSSGADTPRFVRAGIALRLSEASAGEFTPAAGQTLAQLTDSPQVRDIIISALSSRTAAQLGTESGRTSVKKDIVKRVNADTDLKILDVYYTEFAVQ